jgi:hypothetical protein
MVDKTSHALWRGLRLPLYTAIVGLAVFTPIAFCSPDMAFLFDIVFVLLLIVVSVGLFVWLIQEAIANRYEQFLPTLGMLAVLWAISMSLFFYERGHPFELHETAKWLARSHYYKSEVLARPESTTELKHIEWDMSGFAGVANNTVYLVFDPADSLSMAAKSHQPGKFEGIPCEVRLIRRLESNWYAVLLYTDQYWGACK